MTQVTAQTNSTDDRKIISTQDTPASSGQKEAEPAVADSNFEKEGRLISEIKEVSAEADRRAEQVVTAELGKIGEQAKFIETVGIPKDVNNAGVRDIAGDARDVIVNGSSINLDVTEDEYKDGLKVKVGGISQNKSILHIASVVALAIWVGRQLKRAHVKTMKVVFRRGAGNAD